MKRFSSRDTLMKVAEQFLCQWQCPVKAFLQLPICLSGIFFRTQCHHVSLQFGIVEGELHEEADEKPPDGTAACEDSFVEAHTPKCPADFFLGKSQRAVGMIDAFDDILAIGDHVPDRIGDGKIAIPVEEEAVKFVFYDEMVVAGLFGLRDYIAVAFTVQYKVADITEQIGISAVVRPLFPEIGEQALQIGAHRLTVLPVADPVCPQLQERMIKKQEIRSLQADPKLIGIFLYDLPEFFGQEGSGLFTKRVMCINTRHFVCSFRFGIITKDSIPKDRLYENKILSTK